MNKNIAKRHINMPDEILFENKHIKIVGGVEIAKNGILYTLTSEFKDKNFNNTSYLLSEYLSENKKNYGIINYDMDRVDFERTDKGLKEALGYLFGQFETTTNITGEIYKHINTETFFHFIKTSQEKAHQKHENTFIGKSR